jgi:serine protease Do
MKLSDWLYSPLRLAFCTALLFLAGAMPVLAQLDVNNQNNPNSPNFRRFPDFADLVEKASPAVVNIRTTEKVAVYQMPSNITPQDQAEFLRRFFGIPLPAQPNPSPPPKGQAPGGQSQEQNRGTGSGFIMDSNGYILTNAHVIEGATTIYVTLTDKREFKAKLIGSDPRTDVALVKIEASNLPKLPVGDSSRVRVGEWVLAIGSPFGLDNTVTAGIVSAKGRETNDSITPFIQTDVAINPGNSGGPLINTRGEVIGINSQIYSKSGGYMGISFAIPIDEVIRISEQLKVNGRIVRGRIGVTITELTKELAESINFVGRRGVLIRAVEQGAPAALAGLEVGDVITKINEKEIERGVDLTRSISEIRPGTRARLQVWRKGSNREVNVMVVEIEPPRSPKPLQ